MGRLSARSSRSCSSPFFVESVVALAEGGRGRSQIQNIPALGRLLVDHYGFEMNASRLPRGQFSSFFGEYKQSFEMLYIYIYIYYIIYIHESSCKEEHEKE
jgi:hypothetical protein